MKIYVVLQSNRYTDYEFCGVYLTKEKAQQRVDQILKDNGKTEDGLYIEEYDQLD